MHNGEKSIFLILIILTLKISFFLLILYLMNPLKKFIKCSFRKRKQDYSRVEIFTYDEGLCVQCMHIGSYDDEPKTVDLMHKYMEENGYILDITENRFHHEIYLSDPRKCDVSKLKTVIRHPIKKIK